VSGDTGFATQANLEAMAERRVRAYLAPGRIVPLADSTIYEME
jgi:hypothetical protein